MCRGASPIAYYQHLPNRFGAVCLGKRQSVSLCDEESSEGIVNINSLNIATSDEKLKKSCKLANNHILLDDMKVDEEDAHSSTSSDMSNFTSSLDVEILGRD